MTFQISDEFFTVLSEDFLDTYQLTIDDLISSIVLYMKNQYLVNHATRITSEYNSWKKVERIAFHKIEVSSNGKSAEKSNRVLLFILGDQPEKWQVTVYPVFAFTTQMEKKFTTQYMKGKEFGNKMFSLLEWANDVKHTKYRVRLATGIYTKCNP